MLWLSFVFWQTYDLIGCGIRDADPPIVSFQNVFVVLFANVSNILPKILYQMNYKYFYSFNI